MDLYLAVQSVDWPSVFSADKTFAVHFNGTNDEIRNSQYGALKVKDAIVDSFTRKTGTRRMWQNSSRISASMSISIKKKPRWQST